jgi:hypothetical protein
MPYTNLVVACKIPSIPTNTDSLMKLTELLKDSAYKLTQFTAAHIQTLENRIIIKQIRDKTTPYIVCLVRGKDIKLTLEEVCPLPTSMLVVVNQYVMI